MAFRSLTRTFTLSGTLTRRLGANVRSQHTNPTEFVVPSQPKRYVVAGGLALLTFSIPFITVGAYGAKMMASGLEDLDLFVPDDDDD